MAQPKKQKVAATDGDENEDDPSAENIIVQVWSNIEQYLNVSKAEHSRVAQANKKFKGLAMNKDGKIICSRFRTQWWTSYGRGPDKPCYLKVLSAASAIDWSALRSLQIRFGSDRIGSQEPAEHAAFALLLSGCSAKLEHLDLSISALTVSHELHCHFLLQVAQGLNRCRLKTLDLSTCRFEGRPATPDEDTDMTSEVEFSRALIVSMTSVENLRLELDQWTWETLFAEMKRAGPLSAANCDGKLKSLSLSARQSAYEPAVKDSCGSLSDVLRFFWERRSTLELLRLSIGPVHVWKTAGASGVVKDFFNGCESLNNVYVFNSTDDVAVADAFIRFAVSAIKSGCKRITMYHEIKFSDEALSEARAFFASRKQLFDNYFHDENGCLFEYPGEKP